MVKYFELPGLIAFVLFAGNLRDALMDIGQAGLLAYLEAAGIAAVHTSPRGLPA